MRLQQRLHAGHGSQHGDALAANGFHQPRRHQALFKVQFGGKNTGGTHNPIVCPNT